MMKFTVLALSVTAQTPAQTPETTRLLAAAQLPTTDVVNNPSAGETSTLPLTIRDQVDASEGLVSGGSQVTASSPAFLQSRKDIVEGTKLPMDKATEVTDDSDSGLLAAAQLPTTEVGNNPSAGVQGAASGAADVAKTVGSTVVSLAEERATQEAQKIKNGLSDKKDEIEGAVSDKIADVKEELTEQKDKFETFAENGLNKFNDQKNKVFEEAKGAAGTAIDKLVDQGEALGKGNEHVAALFNFLGGGAKTLAENALALGKDKLDNFQGHVKDKLKEKYEDVKGSVQETAQNVRHTLKDKYEDVKGSVQETAQNAEEQGSSFWDKLKLW